MLTQNSILAGEILSVLEKATCSIRIMDIETIFQTSKRDMYLAIARLLSEGLVELIKEGERSAIVLKHNARMPENWISEPVMAGHV